MTSPNAAKWLAAECYELDQLTCFNTYQLSPLPCNQSCTGCCWVYKIKHDVNSDIILYCAYLVAQGFTQCPGEDFLKHLFLLPSVRDTVTISDYMHIFYFPFNIPISPFLTDVLLLFSTKDMSRNDT